MGDRRSPSFLSGGRDARPGVPLSRRKAEISFAPVRAKRTKRSATVACVIHAFRPVRTKPSPSASARVASAAASEPVSGSVSAKAPRELARGEAREVPALLLVGSETRQDELRQPVDGERAREGAPGDGELLEDESIRGGVGASPAGLGREGDPAEPHGAETREERTRELVRGRGGEVRPDLRAHEAADGLGEGLLFLRPQVVEERPHQRILGTISCLPSRPRRKTPPPSSARQLGAHRLGQSRDGA